LAFLRTTEQVERMRSQMRTLLSLSCCLGCQYLRIGRDEGCVLFVREKVNNINIKKYEKILNKNWRKE